MVTSHLQHEIISILDIDFTILDSFDLLVLSGSSKLSVHNTIFVNLLSYLIQRTDPVIGICLGYQLLCKAYDPFNKNVIVHGHVPKVYGKQKTFVTEGNWHKKEYDVFKSHRYSLEITSSEIFSVFSNSAMGSDIIKHNDKPHWGLSFHPECGIKNTDGRILFKEILDKIFY